MLKFLHIGIICRYFKVLTIMAGLNIITKYIPIFFFFFENLDYKIYYNL